MDLDTVLKSRLAQENKASSQIQDAIKQMRSDVEKTNEQVAERLRLKDQPEQDIETEEEPNYSNFSNSSVESDPVPVQKISITKKPLIYFSFQIGYELPPWVISLRQILVQAGYFVYNPAERVSEQFGKPDLDGLNALDKKLVKPLCSTLGVNENVLLPFEVVANILDQGDKGDSFASVFKAQWFLTRASVLVSDLTFAGSDSSQELLFAKQLGIPSIGMFPPSGQISPWQHQNCTVLYTPQNLQYLIQLIRGFV